MSELTAPSFYIRLIVPKALPRDKALFWFKICRKKLPSGVLGNIQVNKPDYGIESVQLVHRTIKNGQHLYEIPLNRDLLEREVEPVVLAWNAYWPEGDYNIESSAEQILNARQQLAGAIQMEETHYNDLCETLAKHQHASWCLDKEAQGWRYGISHNQLEKTHPMLRPWEQLPADYRRVDYKLPQVFLDVLDKMGLAVVEKKSLPKSDLFK